MFDRKNKIFSLIMNISKRELTVINLDTGAESFLDSHFLSLSSEFTLTLLLYKSWNDRDNDT